MNRAIIRAKLHLGAIPINQYQASAVYTCTGLALDAQQPAAESSSPEGEVKGYSDVKLSSWFKEAMVWLSRQKKVLVSRVAFTTI